MKKGLAAGAQRQKLSFVQSVAPDGSLVAGPVEGWEFVTVQQPVQPVAGKFRDNHGVHQRRDDSNECDMQAFVNHGRSSFHSLLAIPEAEHDAEGGAGRLRRAIRKAQADVIELRANSDVTRHGEIHAATRAPGKSVCAATACSEVIASYQCLDERRYAFPAIDRQARTREEGEGIGGDTRLGQVIHAKVPDKTEPVVQIGSTGDTAAMSVSSTGEALAE